MSGLTDTRRSLPRATFDGMANNTIDLIERHLRRCRQAGFSPVTITDREELLRRLDAELPLGVAEAYTEDLQDWLIKPTRFGRTRSPKTMETYFDHVVGFYRDPAIAEAIGWDPSAGLIRPRVPERLPKPATEDEVRFALANLPRPYDMFVWFAAHAGLRAGEIARMERQRVTEDLVRVDEGKGGKSRAVPTHPELWQRIRLVPSGPIAMLGSGRLMTPAQMSLRAAYRLDKIGLGHLSLHCFRHRFGTMLLTPKELGGAGADLLTVSILMGHSNPNTTKIYCLITSEQRRIAVHALPALAPVSR
jgi:integrase/recombinase XerC